MVTCGLANSPSTDPQIPFANVQFRWYHLSKFAKNKNLFEGGKMAKDKGNIVPKGGEILIYQTEGGQTKIEVQLEGENLWINQAGLAKLYQTTIPNINIHIQNISEEGGFSVEATINEYLIVQHEGGRQVSRQVTNYHLAIVLRV